MDRWYDVRATVTVVNLLAAIQPIEERLVTTWKPESRVALARVLHEVYMADGNFTPLERDDFGAFLARIGAKASEVEKIEFDDALALLGKDPVHRKVAFVWIAHALFVDGGYNADEKAFVDRVVSKYGREGEALRAEIKATQSRKIEEGMKAILAELG
jgi:uncharacterized tellurite resistance protein B-like protein